MLACWFACSLVLARSHQGRRFSRGCCGCCCCLDRSNRRMVVPTKELYQVQLTILHADGGSHSKFGKASCQHVTPRLGMCHHGLVHAPNGGPTPRVFSHRRCLQLVLQGSHRIDTGMYALCGGHACGMLPGQGIETNGTTQRRASVFLTRQVDEDVVAGITSRR